MLCSIRCSWWENHTLWWRDHHSRTSPLDRLVNLQPTLQLYKCYFSERPLLRYGSFHSNWILSLFKHDLRYNVPAVKTLMPLHSWLCSGNSGLCFAPTQSAEVLAEVWFQAAGRCTGWSVCICQCSCSPCKPVTATGRATCWFNANSWGQICEFMNPCWTLQCTSTHAHSYINSLVPVLQAVFKWKKQKLFKRLKQRKRGGTVFLKTDQVCL